jgi:hypothetical protein
VSGPAPGERPIGSSAPDVTREVRARSRRRARRLAPWAAAALGAALSAYVLAPCGTWAAEARDPVARSQAAGRRAFAAAVAHRCEDMGTAAAPPPFTCAAETEADDLPVIPRACAGRAHRTFRLHVDGWSTPGGPSEAPAPRATVGRVAAALAAAFPYDAILAPLTPTTARTPPETSPETSPAHVGRGDGLGAIGFTAVEVVRDGRLVGRLTPVDAAWGQARRSDPGRGGDVTPRQP